jgi:hypothetical protein
MKGIRNEEENNYNASKRMSRGKKACPAYGEHSRICHKKESNNILFYWSVSSLSLEKIVRLYPRFSCNDVSTWACLCLAVDSSALKFRVHVY